MRITPEPFVCMKCGFTTSIIEEISEHEGNYKVTGHLMTSVPKFTILSAEEVDSTELPTKARNLTVEEKEKFK